MTAVEETSYDLVLMDIWMPSTDGLEATRRIAEAHPPEARPLIIGITADATLETRTRCLHAGMVECLTKPLSYDRLKSALEHVAGSP